MPESFLLEIGSDEIPARYLPLAIRDLKVKAEAAFRSARLPFVEARTYGTSRRLVLLVYGLEARSQDAVSRARGPSRKAAYDEDGNPTRALFGFSRSLGIDPSQVTVEKENGGEYVYGERREKGRPAPAVLAEILPPVIMGLESPYPLRWGDQGWRWYRPIRWVACLYGADVVPVSVAGIQAGRRTLGHRTLHPGPLDIPSAERYFDVMQQASVVIDPEERRRAIVEGARQAAAEIRGEPVIDEDLLSEVCSLSEHPSAFLGRFEERYRRLPREVLATAMKHHQRYFPVEDARGDVLSGFVGVRDGDPEKGMETVRSGNEWVLRARLKDAEFFFEQDIKVHLEDKLPELGGVRFLRDSGTMLDKARRIEKLARSVAESLGLALLDRDLAANAARLAKVDLVTAMVREFPELEGIMGGRYGELESLDPAITEAMRDQYLPRGVKDRLPASGIPAAVALADKLDTLAVSFSLGTGVSGSADPFGLRRHALGVVGILMGHGYDADLEALLRDPIDLAAGVVPGPLPDAASKLLQFLMSRVETSLLERGFGVEVVRAVLGGGERRIARLPAMAEALTALTGTAKLGDVVTGWRRTSVLAKESGSAGVSPSLFREKPEVALHEAVLERKGALDSLFEGRRYDEYLNLLASLRSPIDRCLDEVLIMAEDAGLRANRIALLKVLSDLFTRYADFAHLLPVVGREG